MTDTPRTNPDLMQQACEAHLTLEEQSLIVLAKAMVRPRYTALLTPVVW